MITWKISGLSAYPEQGGQKDVVFSVAWVCSATDGTLSADVPGSTGVTWKAGDPFTPVAQLTEAQVLGWVHGVMGSEKATVEGYATKAVQDLASPPVAHPPLPWAPPPAPEPAPVVEAPAPAAPEPTPAPEAPAAAPAEG